MDLEFRSGGGAPAAGQAFQFPGAGEVHLWLLPLDAETRVHGECVLSVSESGRAAGFRSPADASRFVISHAYLRRILAGYLRANPGDLLFSVSEFGKPSLPHAEGGPDLRFNMAHSGDAALVAVSAEGQIGVDLEAVRPLDDLYAVARRCFSPRELDLLHSCDEPACTDMFYTFWTRKEAYVKARGNGMSLDLPRIDTSAAPAVLDGRWHVRDIGMYRGCRCALASENPVTRVRMAEGIPLVTPGNRGM